MRDMNAVMAAALELVEAVEASQNPELDVAEREKASANVGALVSRFAEVGIGVLFQDSRAQAMERDAGELINYVTLFSRVKMTRKKAASQLSEGIDVDLLVSPLESGMLTIPVDQPGGQLPREAR